MEKKSGLHRVNDKAELTAITPNLILARMIRTGRKISCRPLISAAPNRTGESDRYE
jgi:hypothetical protein